MSNTKEHARLFALALCWVSLSSCGEKTKEDCAKHIGETIRQGVSLEVAQAKLKECGFKIKFDPVKNTLYGDKVKEGNPVAERAQVNIRVDSNKKVTEVIVSSGLIGP